MSIGGIASAGPTEPQRDALRAAASLLLGHFRAEAAAHLARAGSAGEIALRALDAGEPTMEVHARIGRLLGAPASARKRR